MIRTAFAATALMLTFTGPAISQAQEEECRKFGQIVTNIVAERRNGTSARRAERRILANIPNSSKNDEVLAVQLVAWIYSVPEDQLSDDYAQQIYRECMKQ